MSSSRKKLLIMSSLAATAVFSTASISTVYYNYTGNISSTQVCQPKRYDGQFGASIQMWRQGIVNVNENKTVTVACPVNTGSEKEGSAYAYDFHVVATGRYESSVGTVSCTLQEVSSTTADVTQMLQRSASVYGQATESLNWTGVTRLVSTGDSAFNLWCDLPPNIGLVNISIKAEEATDSAG